MLEGNGIRVVAVWGLVLLAAGVHRASAQVDEIIIGQDSSTWHFPLSTYYHDARTQTIYLADEIGDAYLITGLALYVTQPPGQTMNTFTIRMKHTDLSVYGSQPGWEPSGWTVVYQAHETVTATGWVQFNFGNPFVYNGSQNLMVDISFDNSSWTSDGHCRYSVPGGTRTLYFRTDSGHGSPLTWSHGNPQPNVTAYVPNIKLIVAPSIKVAMPTFSPDGWAFHENPWVTVTCATPGATIHYTTDGSEPAQNDPVVVSGGQVLVSVSPPTTLRARAWKAGQEPSDIREAEYRIPNVIYVSRTGNNANSGTSWAAAKRTVGAGLNTAQPADSVWVARGTYVETIVLRPGVALYGGFAGTENPMTFSLADRNFVVNETILDGNQAGSVVSVPQGLSATARIDGFTITHGEAMSGGGINVWNASPTIAHNTITANVANWAGGGIYLSGASPMIIGNTITGNFAISEGGGIYLDDASPTITRNTIADNNAASGGGLHMALSSPAVLANTIAGNTADQGGGIRLSMSSPDIVNNALIGNSASDGGGIHCGSDAYPMIAGNTLVANSASFGGAISLGTMDGHPSITNTIIAFNSSGIHRWSGKPTLKHNCVYGNANYQYAGLDDPTGTQGNISQDPMFVQPPHPGPDGQWGTADDDYGDLRLLAASICVDTGDNDYVVGGQDLDGLPRVIDGTGDGLAIVDMGAHEYLPPIPADFDGDGDVDEADFAIFAACYTGPAVAYNPNNLPPGCPLEPDAGGIIAADFNADGVVDHLDFAAFQRCISGTGIPAQPGCATP